MKIRFCLAVAGFIVLGGLLDSCAPTKGAHLTGSKKMRGGWMLASVDVEDTAAIYQSLPIFEDAGISCLKGTAWTFDENDLGEYTVVPANTGSCIKGIRKINWLMLNINGTDFLQFRRASAVAGVKKDRFTNYILEIESLDKTMMRLKYPVYYNGNTTVMHFNFKHIGK